LGAAGVAVGALHADGNIDLERSRELIRQSRPMRATFHRAFDETPNLREALEAVIQTGADCLLTSGGAADVLAGAEAIADLCRQAGNRINVMAAGGLRLNNIVRLVRHTGVSYIHGSRTQRSSRAIAAQAESAAMLESDIREAVRLLRHEMKLRSASVETPA
jgi:copper homeostasis protein